MHPSNSPHASSQPHHGVCVVHPPTHDPSNQQDSEKRPRGDMYVYVSYNEICSLVVQKKSCNNCHWLISDSRITPKQISVVTSQHCKKTKHNLTRRANMQIPAVLELEFDCLLTGLVSLLANLPLFTNILMKRSKGTDANENICLMRYSA